MRLWPKISPETANNLNDLKEVFPHVRDSFVHTSAKPGPQTVIRISVVCLNIRLITLLTFSDNVIFLVDLSYVD